MYKRNFVVSYVWVRSLAALSLAKYLYKALNFDHHGQVVWNVVIRFASILWLTCKPKNNFCSPLKCTKEHWFLTVDLLQYVYKMHDRTMTFADLLKHIHFDCIIGHLIFVWIKTFHGWTPWPKLWSRIARSLLPSNEGNAMFYHEAVGNYRSYPRTQ